MTRKMYDSVTTSHLPKGGDLYLAYLDGLYAQVAAVRKAHPRVPVVTITVFGDLDAQACDCETGDLTPASAARWAKGKHARGEHPTIYTSLANWETCKAACRQVGLDPEKDVSWFIAHYDGVGELSPGMVGKQYLGYPLPSFPQGQSPGPYDVSVVADYWPGVDKDKPAPKPKPKPHPQPERHPFRHRGWLPKWLRRHHWHHRKAAK